VKKPYVENTTNPGVLVAHEIQVRLQSVQRGGSMADFVHGRQEDIEPEDGDQSEVQLPSKAPDFFLGVALPSLEHLSQLGCDVFLCKVMLPDFASQLVDFANIVVVVVLGNFLGWVPGRGGGLNLRVHCAVRRVEDV